MYELCFTALAHIVLNRELNANYKSAKSVNFKVDSWSRNKLLFDDLFH